MLHFYKITICIFIIITTTTTSAYRIRIIMALKFALIWSDTQALAFGLLIDMCTVVVLESSR